MLLDSLINKAAQVSSNTVAVAAAEDLEVIEAVIAALDRNLAIFILFGDEEKINSIIELKKQKNISNNYLKVINADSNAAAAELAVKAVFNKEANVLMKGNIPTNIFLKAVLNKEYGLRTGNVLSHIAAFEVPGFNRFTIVTDAAMNIAPDLEQKAQIIKNAVSLARSIGIEIPKVAPIAAVEVVNPAMQATLDAALLTVMNKRGQISDCIIDGPLGLDNAVSTLAAEHKGIHSEVAGNADILLVPTIEVGNVLYKSLIYFANAKVGAVIAGAKAPIVLTSRADSAESKLYSLALALCCATTNR
ncbi:phosphate butyryltransferase [Bacillus sp. ISL-40]|uniref:phosphate butyryltransferase n=1 Tax=unclassified Bacillus (in: firmicutes) TaxID=185979 RepID=UPI001BE83BB5|nr:MULTISPECIES: phosphate butyryltransferase [unclassified Bacillus (in: firmicutes)]MBT2698667.1 phosphate butyryltransferase [Bacillus sp. ISL-40]MBT2724811.1 phosphate butyryltransferase [Bacillus sp. ISL-46]MBT2743510.1 phosphate butyryltransferase [Bacillus sp. ISL-77]